MGMVTPPGLGCGLLYGGAFPPAETPFSLIPDWPNKKRTGAARPLQRHAAPRRGGAGHHRAAGPDQGDGGHQERRRLHHRAAPRLRRPVRAKGRGGSLLSRGRSTDTYVYPLTQAHPTPTGRKGSCWPSGSSSGRGCARPCWSSCRARTARGSSSTSWSTTVCAWTCCTRSARRSSATPSCGASGWGRSVQKHTHTLFHPLSLQTHAPTAWTAHRRASREGDRGLTISYFFSTLPLPPADLGADLHGPDRARTGLQGGQHGHQLRPAAVRRLVHPPHRPHGPRRCVAVAVSVSTRSDPTGRPPLFPFRSAPSCSPPPILHTQGGVAWR
jgi:hypothetical protein